MLEHCICTNSFSCSNCVLASSHMSGSSQSPRAGSATHNTDITEREPQPTCTAYPGQSSNQVTQVSKPFHASLRHFWSARLCRTAISQGWCARRGTFNLSIANSKSWLALPPAQCNRAASSTTQRHCFNACSSAESCGTASSITRTLGTIICSLAQCHSTANSTS